MSTAGQAIAQVRHRAKSAGAGGSSMERWMCWGTLGVTALLMLLFLFDLFVGSFPLYGASKALDIFGLLAGGVIIYICIDTLRELK